VVDRDHLWLRRWVCRYLGHRKGDMDGLVFVIKESGFLFDFRLLLREIFESICSQDQLFHIDFLGYFRFHHIQLLFNL